MSNLTPQEQFNRDGFYIARNLLKAEDVVATREGLRRSFNDQLAHLGIAESDDIFTAMRSLHAKDITRYKKLVGAIWRKIEVYDLMHHRNILQLLKDKFGWRDIFLPGGQVVHIMADELKIPDGYFGLVPHQDFPSVQGSLDGVVVWLPLVDVDRDNYPLDIIPGSHLLGLLQADESSTSTWEVNDVRYRDDAFVPIEVGVGDVVFMSVFMVHRSSQKGTPGRLRISMSTRFDNAAEKTFIDRCYPTAYTRSVHREQYVKDFPSLDQVTRIFSNK